MSDIRIAPPPSPLVTPNEREIAMRNAQRQQGEQLHVPPVMAPPGVLGGHRVQFRRLGDPNRAPGAIVQDSHNRLQQMKIGGLGKFFRTLGAAVGGLVVGAGAIATAAVSLVPLAAGALIGKIRDGCSRGLRQARQDADHMRNTLGVPHPNGLMGRNIRVGDGTLQTIGQVMEGYRTRLGANVTAAQMQTYINMGERIVDAINNQPGYNGGPITVNGIVVKPNLETTRAISWYMQAKGVADNAKQSGSDPHLLNRGSMVVADPGGKLYAFLNSAPNVYGRASTHFHERSHNPDTAGLGNTGFTGMLAGLKGGQPAQRGIEDFDNRMPSGKGCLLFDKLEDTAGSRQILLKWESAGMPSVLGTGTHADAEEGWTGKVVNRFRAQFRCMEHTCNFVKSLTSGGGEAWGEHREAVDKGATKPVFEAFSRALRALEDRGKIPPGSASVAIKEAKHFGVAYMNDMMDDLAQRLTPGTRPVPGELLLARDELRRFGLAMGNDLGIERRGAEIHAQRDTSYL